MPFIANHASHANHAHPAKPTTHTRRCHPAFLTALAGCLLAGGILTGCTNGNGPSADSPGVPRGRGPVSMDDLSGQLGLHLSCASVYSASMRNDLNTVLVIGPPSPAVIVNGRRLNGRGGVAMRDGQLSVTPELAVAMRSKLRRPTRIPRRTQPAPRRPIGPVNMQRYTVVLDPGHGGRDPGAPNPRCPNLPEKDVNLDTARRLRSILTARGVNVLMTRDDDTFVDLNDRPALANRTGADLFVSIHADSNNSPNPDGFTIFIGEAADGRSVSAANAVAARLRGVVTTSRGVRRRDLRVLTRNKRPAMLVELGFLSNPGEGRKLSTPAYRQRLADAIATGVMNYLSAH